MKPTAAFIARAFSDADDRLIEAQDPLATLQLRSGGEIPGKIATPAILELVRKARRQGASIAQTIHARDDEDSIEALIQVHPAADGQGCEIVLTDWHSAPLAAEDPEFADRQKAAIDRELAEIWARLDRHQNVLTAGTTDPALQPLVDRMQQAAGQPWTDFVEIEGAHYHQPMHWRLLDGARLRLPDDEREWTAILLPAGRSTPVASGFELFLVASRPVPARGDDAAPSTAGAAHAGAAIGREIAPVLRHPIGRIVTNAETIRARLAGPIADEYSNYAADIAAAGEHLLTLIDDLVDFEAIESEGFTPAMEWIDLAELARRAAALLSVRAEERKIAIEAPTAADTLPAIGELRRVLQILLNIIGNAILYSPEEARIAIGLEREQDRVAVSVSDQGPGLDEEQREAVFQKFERLGRSGDGGTGLGLYISRRLARAMGGDLVVASSPGKGSRFTLVLPAGE